MEVSAELDFLDQQNLILNLENKALKQRLDSLAQEHLIKRREYITVNKLQEFHALDLRKVFFRHSTLFYFT